MRLFVGIESSHEIERWVAAVAAALAPRCKELRWTPSEKAHWTLAFLGEQAEDRVPALREAMETAATASEPFGLTLGPLGAFASWRRARVLWVGPEQGERALGQVAERLKEALQARRFPIEERSFRAHLTLAKARQPMNLERLREVRLDPPPPMRVERLTLFRSFLHPQGSRYEPLFAIPLSRNTSA